MNRTELNSTYPGNAQKKTSHISIINTSSWKTNTQKIGEWSFTTVMWSVWIYFLLPVINIFIWIIAGNYIYKNVFLSGQYTELAYIVKNGLNIFIVLFIIIGGWAFYNKVRFYNKNRRTNQSHASQQEIADFFSVDKNILVKMKSEKQIRWHSVYKNN